MNAEVYLPRDFSVRVWMCFIRSGGIKDAVVGTTASCADTIGTEDVSATTVGTEGLTVSATTGVAGGAVIAGEGVTVAVGVGVCVWVGATCCTTTAVVGTSYCPLPPHAARM